MGPERYPQLQFQQRNQPLTRTDGILQEVVQEAPLPFQVVVSQNWYVPALTKALCRCALRIATTQSQFNNCVVIWMNPQEPRTFVQLWIAAMVIWFGLAFQCTLAEIRADLRSGDYALAPLSEAQGCKAKCWLMVHQASLFACIFILDLLNVPRDLRYLVTRLHMGGMMNRRIYGADSLRNQYNFEFEAQHRYVVLEYEDESVHNFQNNETATVHWILHIVSVFMLYFNFQQIFGSGNHPGSQPGNWTAQLENETVSHDVQVFIPGCSLLLTACSLGLEIYNAVEYLKVRRAYKDFWGEKQRTGNPLEQREAAFILGTFWF